MIPQHIIYNLSSSNDNFLCLRAKVHDMLRVDLFFVSVLNVLKDLNVWSAFGLFHRRRPFQLRPDVVPPLVVQRDRSSLRVEERLVVQPEKVCLELRKINLKSCTDKVYLQTNKTSKIPLNLFKMFACVKISWNQLSIIHDLTNWIFKKSFEFYKL